MAQRWPICFNTGEGDMSIIVEHDKRRSEILDSAMDVFVEDGFENVTFQKIADRCGITRTTLYLYFKNKRDIFNFSIKQLLSEIEADIQLIRAKNEATQTQKLLEVMYVIIDRLEENQKLLLVILGYLHSVSKTDFNPDYRIRRRTVRLRHILATILVEGIKKGDFRQSVNVKEANELLYSFIEAAVFRLVILRNAKVGSLRDAIALAVQSFGKPAK